MSLKVSLFTVAFAFSVPITVESFGFKCKKEGRFSDPSDCSSYIECIFNQDIEDFETKNGTCGKGGFDPKQQKCVSLKSLKDCQPPRTGRLTWINPEFDFMCSEESGFFCGDCNTLVNCVEGKAISEKCADRSFCQLRESFAGAAVCYPEYLSECTCAESNVFLSDPYNEKVFFFCDAYALPTFYRCPEEMVYDKYLEQCVHPEGLPLCTDVGVFAHDDDCRKYYTCISSNRGWVQKLLYCPLHTMYNERSSQCEDPCRWVRQDFICQEEGRFPDKTNCQAFFECIKVGAEDTFRMTKRTCPDGYNWQEDSRGSNKGFCISVEDSKCQAYTPTKCDVPPDWCEEEEKEVAPSFEDSLFDGGESSSPEEEAANSSRADSEDVMNGETMNIDDTNSLLTAEKDKVTEQLGNIPTAYTLDSESSTYTTLPTDNEESHTFIPLILTMPVVEQGNEIEPSPKSNVRILNRLLYQN